MPFAPVKSSPYGQAKRKRLGPMWSEQRWRLMVLMALLEVGDWRCRSIFAELCCFDFKDEELINGR